MGAAASGGNKVLQETVMLNEKVSNVQQNCYNEALTCETSPLGYHLVLTVKEKIRW